ncbi:hypothetical protein PMAYCL1PPCAC_18005, partial [Pristionchus mayeri]
TTWHVLRIRGGTTIRTERDTLRSLASSVKRSGNVRILPFQTQSLKDTRSSGIRSTTRQPGPSPVSIHRQFSSLRVFHSLLFSLDESNLPLAED